MKWPIYLAVGLASLAIVGAVMASPPRITVRTDDVTVTSSGDVSVTVGESVPVSGTSVPTTGTAKPTNHLFRYAVYAVTGVAAAFAFQWIKRRFLLTGKRAVTAAAFLCAVLGAGTTALFKDGSVSAIISNPWNIAGAGGIAFSFAQLAYKLWVK